MEAFPAEVDSATPDLAHDPALGLDRRTKFEILGAVLLGLFLGALDQTIVGPVLPRIVGELHGADYYTWVVTAYLLTSTVSVPIYGKLSDLYGRKPLLMGGIVLFLIGSALSGLSQEMWQLILFRGIQGIGAGALFPIALAVIGDLFTPAERGRYQGLFGAVFGIAFLVGPGLGGFLTDQFSWHWIFYVNIPIGIVSLAIIWRLLPSVAAGKKVTVDWLGAFTLVLGLVGILVALTIAEDGNWSNPYIWAWLGGGLAFLVAFLAVERRAVEPIVPLYLFRNRTFSASMIAIFFAAFGFSAAIIFLPLYFQVVEGASATSSGYRLLPFLFGLIASSIASGAIVSRTGRYRTLLLGGIAILVVGLGLMTQLRADTPDLTLAIWMFVAGVGVGPTFAVFTIVVQNAVPFQQLGAATSDLTLFRQIGTTVGLTIAFTLFRNNLTWDLLRTEVVKAGAPPSLLPATAPPGFDLGQLTSPVSSGNAFAFLGQLPAAIQQDFLNGFHSAFTIAIANSMYIGVATAVLALAATVFLRDIPLRTTNGARSPVATGSAPGAQAPLGGSPVTPVSAAEGAASSARPRETPAQPAFEQAMPPEKASGQASGPATAAGPAAALPESSGAAFTAYRPETRRASTTSGSAEAVRVGTVGAVAAIGAAAVVGVVAARGRWGAVGDLLRALRLR